MSEVGDMDNVVYVSYEEAQELLPTFRYLKERGPRKEVRLDASAIVRELEMVDDREYSKTGGKQIFLSSQQAGMVRVMRG